MPNLHTGSAQMHTPFGKFLLSQLLNVSSITKNLLSVRQFCHDNSVYFEFHSYYFFVKDLQTWGVLLQGTVKNGLYVLPMDATTPTSITASAQAYIGERTSSL